MKSELFLIGHMWIVGSAATSKGTASWLVMLATGVVFVVASYLV